MKKLCIICVLALAPMFALAATQTASAAEQLSALQKSSATDQTSIIGTSVPQSNSSAESAMKSITVDLPKKASNTSHTRYSTHHTPMSHHRKLCMAGNNRHWICSVNRKN